MFFEKKNLSIFFFTFFFAGVFNSLHLPPGAMTPAPGCFLIEDSMGSGSRSTAYQPKISIFFFLKVKTFFSYNRLNRTQKIFHRNQTKKINLATFFTFFTFQIDHISKTKNRKTVFFLFFILLNI